MSIRINWISKKKEAVNHKIKNKITITNKTFELSGLLLGKTDGRTEVTVKNCVQGTDWTQSTVKSNHLY